MSKCLECSNLDLKSNPRHANVGFGHCKHTPVGSFYSVTREVCERFKEAPQDVVSKRVEWYSNLRRKS